MSTASDAPFSIKKDRLKTGLSYQLLSTGGSGLFSYGLVVAALGRIDLAGLLQLGAGLGNFFGIHTKSLGDIAGTDGLASFFHSVEDLIFHGELLMCGLRWL